MEATHTPVPWNSEAEFSISGTMAEAIDKQGVPIYHNGFHIGTWLDNEWQGMCPNVSFILEACNNYERVKAERDALLAACQKALSYFNGTRSGRDWRDNGGEEPELLQSAIKKAMPEA